MKLGMAEVAGCIDARHAREPDGWRKTRLLAVKLAARGEWTSAQIADVCGIARGHLFVWLKIVRERGLDALLERGQPGPKHGVCRGSEAEGDQGAAGEAGSQRVDHGRAGAALVAETPQGGAALYQRVALAKKRGWSAARAATQPLPKKVGSANHSGTSSRTTSPTGFSRGLANSAPR